MTAEPNHLKKYEPVETREFVDFSAYDELTIENIKEACEKYFDVAAGSCDVLLGDRGPSCYLTEQITSKKKFYVRFIDNHKHDKEHGKRNISIGSSLNIDTTAPLPLFSIPTNVNMHTPTSSRYRIQNCSSKPSFTKSVVMPSLSICDLLKARKLIKPRETEEWLVKPELFCLASKAWKPIQEINLTKEKQSFAEGGFRDAYLATDKNKKQWVIKTVKSSKEADIKNLGLSQHTRK